MLIDWQTQTYDKVNYAFADKAFLKEGGHAGFQLASQNWSPIQLAEFVNLRISIIAKLVQSTLIKIAVWPSKEFSIVSDVNLDKKEVPISISVNHTGPEGHRYVGRFIETIEQDMKAMDFHWRLWSFEF